MTQKNSPPVLRRLGSFPLISFNKSPPPFTIKHKRVYIETFITCVISTLTKSFELILYITVHLILIFQKAKSKIFANSDIKFFNPIQPIVVLLHPQET